jgi:arylformamidase
LIIRTLPNDKSKLTRNYNKTNPPYLEESLATYLNKQGIFHLLVDLPSLDREEDGGKLSAHKAFWGIPNKLRPSATITELIYVPNEVKDGTYLLNLQIAAFELDATPSKPVLYPQL